MDYLLSLSAHLMELIISFSFFRNIFGIKQTYEKRIIPYFSAFFLFLLEYVLYVFVDSTAINIIAYFIVDLILCFAFFNARFLYSVIAAAFLSAVLTASEFFTMLLLTTGQENNVVEYRKTTVVFALGIIISRFIFYVITKISEFAGLYLRKIQNSRIPIFLFLYPLTTIVILYTFWIIAAQYELSKRTDIVIIVCSLAILVSVFLTFVFYGKTSKKMEELYKEQSELSRIRTEKAYYSILDKQNETLKMITHDEKNHLLAIKTIANDPEVSEYIDKIYGEIRETSSFGNTDNKYLDLLINKYHAECEANQILFEYSIKTANLSFMEPTDMISMISNILDNAVDAAKQTNEKKILLSINRKNAFDILTCQNSCDRKPMASEGVLLSTKKIPGIHGYGMKSIMKTAKKYDGEVNWTYDEMMKSFQLMIAFASNRQNAFVTSDPSAT